MEKEITKHVEIGRLNICVKYVNWKKQNFKANKNLVHAGKLSIVKDKETNQSRGFAFVSFATRESAEIAMQKLNGYGYYHLILKVVWAQPSTRENTRMWILYHYFLILYPCVHYVLNVYQSRQKKKKKII